MNTQVGKSTGIALLLAAGLLAALFATGVFSAQGVGATSHSTAATLTALAVNDGTNDLTLTPTFVAATNDYTAEVPEVATTLLVTATPATGTAAVITPEDSDDGTAGHQIDLTDTVISEIEVTVTDSDDSDDDTAATNFDEAVYTVKLNYESPTNSEIAGAAVRLTIMAMLRAEIDDVITIDLASFGMPSAIDEGDVTINRVNPADVSVSGGAISLVLPDLDEDGDPAADAALLADTHDLGGTDGKELATIRISNRAGITNPTKAGTYPVKVRDEDYAGETADVDAVSFATVIRSISIDPDDGGSGTEITVTGKGYSDGQATIFIDVTCGGCRSMTTSATDAC